MCVCVCVQELCVCVCARAKIEQSDDWLIRFVCKHQVGRIFCDIQLEHHPLALKFYQFVGLFKQNFVHCILSVQWEIKDSFNV